MMGCIKNEKRTLADEAGVHRTFMGNVERGERNIGLENIVKIAKALDCRPSKLLDYIT